MQTKGRWSLFLGNTLLWIRSRNTKSAMFEVINASERLVETNDGSVHYCFSILSTVIVHIYSTLSIPTRYIPKYPHSPIHFTHKSMESILYAFMPLRKGICLFDKVSKQSIHNNEQNPSPITNIPVDISQVTNSIESAVMKAFYECLLYVSWLIVY